jgi:hypothetical protein
VARLKRRDGQAIGSGFLVDPEDFGLPQSDAPHLLTCSSYVRRLGADALKRSEAVGDGREPNA